MDLEKYKRELVQKLVQDETFQSKMKQVCDFILSLSMKNKGVITNFWYSKMVLCI